MAAEAVTEIESVYLREENQKALRVLVDSVVSSLPNMLSSVTDVPFDVSRHFDCDLFTPGKKVKCDTLFRVYGKPGRVSFQIHIYNKDGPPIATYQLHLDEKKPALFRKSSGIYTSGTESPVVIVADDYHGLGIGTALFDACLPQSETFIRSVQGAVHAKRAEVHITDMTSGENSGWTEYRLREAGYSVSHGKAILDIQLENTQRAS
jgi:hypothetical protein